MSQGNESEKEKKEQKGEMKLEKWKLWLGVKS